MVLQFEPIADAHRKAVKQLIADPSLASGKGTPAERQQLRDPWHTERLAMRAQRTCYDFAIIADNQLVGVCGITCQRDSQSGLVESWIGKPYWRKGYGTAAAHFLVQYGFRDLGRKLLRAEALVRNHVATHILEKAGFHLSHVDQDVHDRWGRESFVAHYIQRQEIWQVGAGI